MARLGKVDQYSIERPVTSGSMRGLHEFLDDILPEDQGRAKIQRGHLPLFKLSMLSREARKNFRAPSCVEALTRTYDQNIPTWDPFSNVRFTAIGAVAHRGRLIVNLDRSEVEGDHKDARHVLRVKSSQLANGFTFSPYVGVSMYDESDNDAIDRLYDAEAILDDELSRSPITLEFSPAQISIAASRHDRAKVEMVFTPKNKPQPAPALKD